ncbi:MAG: hypothetical protein JNK00_00335 [Flavipsychrobacter sp.]|nr:hypothetical protein [Flavipsychrobacter sp.]
MSNKPNYTVYNVTSQKDKPDFWNEVGGAFIFKTKTGRIGINFPNMKLVLLESQADSEHIDS